MLPAKNRLTRRGDFSNTYRKGKAFYGENIAIKTAKNSLPETRIGFSVGKKFSKKAVLRNKARRKLREAVHFHLKQFKPGFDIVVFLKKRGIMTEKEGLSEAKEDIIKILKKANLLKD